jgi:hypothetical protein
MREDPEWAYTLEERKILARGFVIVGVIVTIAAILCGAVAFG